MSFWRLVRASLGFYWRSNLGVLLAATVSTAVLVGALAVGDCVRYSLEAIAAARLGNTELAVAGQNRFFRSALADELGAELKTTVAPVLQVRGLIANSGGTKRANRVSVLGVDARFFAVGGGGNPLGDDQSEAVVLNEALASKIGVAAGDEVVVRIEKPSLMPRDVPLTPGSDMSLAFRVSVKAVAGAGEFGRFSLQANHTSALNVFVRLDWLADKLGRGSEANMLLAAGGGETEITVEKANEAIGKRWQLADAGLDVRVLEQGGAIELRSRRVFVEEHISEAAMGAGEQGVGILSYFVNELGLGEKSTPYSVVTAMGSSGDEGGIVPVDLRDDEIMINRWLADDLGAKAGDLIELDYFVLGPMRKLLERQSTFRVRRIIEMGERGLDRELMPDFPGLADVDNCRDWEPGIPIDLDKIRDRDEDYWDEYRGTPKAFVSLSAGQRMWANRYGNLTAVRWPLSEVSEAEIGKKLLSKVEPGSVGLYFQAVRQRGETAAGQATDFSVLFLGFSFFIVVSALILMGLVFVFGVESRSEQTGTLLAVGFRHKQVRRLLLAQGGALAFAGALLGTGAGLVYTRMMLHGLSTIWGSAVGGSVIDFHVSAGTLFGGATAGVAVSLASMWLTLRRQVRRPACELLAGDVEQQFFASRPGHAGKISLVVSVLAWAGAMAVMSLVRGGDSGAASGTFFGAGVLLLVAGLALGSALLKKRGVKRVRSLRSVRELGFRNATRRSGLLACGVFLVIAVGANRHDPLAGAERRDSGTGGFALYGESAIGVLQDLMSESGRKAVGLGDGQAEVGTVQMRVHDGDDASCFNLNRAQRPRLLGVDRVLGYLGAFGFVDVVEGGDMSDGWGLLEQGQGDDVVPAIGDYATVVWALGKSVGEQVEYTDEKGRAFKLRIVGMVKNSILQGSLVISEDEFMKRFPSEDGYRVFLIDAASDKAGQVSQTLSRGLRDFGMEVTTAAERLAAFSSVEHTYLSIFALLGGLGMVLGSVGLGLVVLRNMLERRGELAMLRAVGFDKRSLKRMAIYEHAGLLVGGLACGVIAALVAVSPALKSPGAEVPYGSLGFMVVAIAVSGVVWIWVATAIASKGEMIEALRNE
jgi:putative ABC transport system permease protein